MSCKRWGGDVIFIPCVKTNLFTNGWKHTHTNTHTQTHQLNMQADPKAQLHLHQRHRSMKESPLGGGREGKYFLSPLDGVLESVSSKQEMKRD